MENYSIKVKRLFLHLSEQFNHSWFSSLVIAKINLGKGKRVLDNGGKYIPGFKLALPEIKGAAAKYTLFGLIANIKLIIV